MPSTLTRSLDDPITKYEGGDEMMTTADRWFVAGVCCGMLMFWLVVAALAVLTWSYIEVPVRYLLASVR